MQGRCEGDAWTRVLIKGFGYDAPTTHSKNLLRQLLQQCCQGLIILLNLSCDRLATMRAFRMGWSSNRPWL
jgi:hypothetical protein